ncbi:hypothetical protein TREMEDRAFT_65175 [Tremella mesenterica DSM 1558]|uniref:uncharacterized protein n=1 Tax=Tremella mesenterica (strain ATCC 24925 / CBS 8224 / DSM 1558 / NBRC 9311 / NRRL Y-6157 / RJB 2259-6 / UBC 559-6) TaxID=578456 RepID=UPI00032D2C39|nr:uncharacterized protein TREMEDRAFT_65175 [Tremella mesenterica DSM 1558]EIW66775.1 hypothetical protein TREMEDRAFT_65175 [Tremella mesenterica DSM 1558]
MTDPTSTIVINPDDVDDGVPRITVPPPSLKEVMENPREAQKVLFGDDGREPPSSTSDDQGLSERVQRAISVLQVLETFARTPKFSEEFGTLQEQAAVGDVILLVRSSLSTNTKEYGVTLQNLHSGAYGLLQCLTIQHVDHIDLNSLLQDAEASQRSLKDDSGSMPSLIELLGGSSNWAPKCPITDLDQDTLQKATNMLEVLKVYVNKERRVTAVEQLLLNRPAVDEPRLTSRSESMSHPTRRAQTSKGV